MYSSKYCTIHLRFAREAVNYYIVENQMDNEMERAYVGLQGALVNIRATFLGSPLVPNFEKHPHL